MKCLSCDCILTNKESTRVYKTNPNLFVDLCEDCYHKSLMIFVDTGPKRDYIDICPHGKLEINEE